jgi:hypothetical protein
MRVQWLLLALLTPCAMAQTPEADRQREYYRLQEQQREEQQRRAQEEMQRQQKSADDARKRDQESRDETTKNIEDYRKRQSQAAPGGQSSPSTRAERPKLPAERNVLLGSWRVESGGQGGGATGLGQGNGTDRNAMARELLTAVSNPCVLMFGKGITFAPSTYSIQALDGGVFQGSVDYSSPQKRVILAITQETWKTLPFEIEGPNRIVWGRFGCALVRVGAPAANAAANATTAPGNARSGAAGPSAPTASTIQYGSYVCGNERVEVFYCRNDRGQPVPEIDNSCAVEYPDRPRRNPSFPVSAAVLKSDLVKQLATCKLSELHLPGLQIGKPARRADIAGRVKGCEAGGIRYAADDKPVFVR